MTTLSGFPRLLNGAAAEIDLFSLLASVIVFRHNSNMFTCMHSTHSNNYLPYI